MGKSESQGRRKDDVLKLRLHFCSCIDQWLVGLVVGFDKGTLLFFLLHTIIMATSSRFPRFRLSIYNALDCAIFPS